MGKRFIPFGWLPGHWGLAGKTRERAKIEYDHSGDPYQSEIELAKLDYSGVRLQRKLLQIDRDHGKIDEKSFAYSDAALLEDKVEKEVVVAQLNHHYGDISDAEYEKTVATLRKEPWVSVVKFDIQGDDAKQGEFELDWNEFFIKKLEDAGYVGRSEDEIIQQWFHEVCKNVAMDVYDGVGDFNERADTDEPPLRNNKTKKNKIKPGKWEAE